MVKRFTSFLLIAFVVFFASNTTQVLGAEFFKPAPVTTLSLNKAWQRQEVIAIVSVETPDEFARLEAEEYSYSNFSIYEIPFERVKIDQGKYIVKIGWVLFPLAAGEYGIELAEVYYKPNSGRKIRLKIPYQELVVKPLPSYIPATMPIGDVAIKNVVQANENRVLSKLHDTESLINWNIELTTNSVLPETIPPILRQVRTTESLDVFPDSSDKNITPTYQGMVNSYKYTVPIKALKSGFLDLPTLNVQHFDPTDEKLKRAISPPSTHWVLNRYIQWFLLALLLVGMMIALVKLIKLIQAYRLKRKMIREAINDIEQSKNTDEVRIALHNLSQAKGWQANTTLQNLLKNWEAQNGQDLVLDSLFNELQSAQFSQNTKANFESIKNGLITSLKRS